MDFFHVTYRDISSFNSFEFRSFDNSIQDYSLPSLYSSDEFRNTIQGLYPKGISTHGEFYLHASYDYKQDSLGKGYVSNSLMIEATFEMVRQWKFPDQPSRFESAFACPSFFDAQNFINSVHRPQAEIYKVSCSNYQIKDMNLLILGRNITENIILAEKYWQGKSSPNPLWEVLMQPQITIIEKM